MKKVCTKCRVEKPLTEFNRDSAKKSGFRGCCRECTKKQKKSYNAQNKDKLRKYRKDNKDYIEQQRQSKLAETAVKRKQHYLLNKDKILEERKGEYNKNKAPYRERALKNSYGISIAEYDEMAIKQSFSCAICGVHQSEVSRALCVDHCHSTGIVRGLLCSNCNTGLGMFKDSIPCLHKAAAYLKEAKDGLE